MESSAEEPFDVASSFAAASFAAASFAVATFAAASSFVADTSLAAASSFVVGAKLEIDPWHHKMMVGSCEDRQNEQQKIR